MYVIALIGIGLVLHGFIMLAFAAFRARPAWGLAVLFVPFAQLFFPVYHWDQARKPFMTFTFGMSLWLGTAIVFGQGPLDKFWLDQIGLVQSAEQFGKRFSRQPAVTLEERAKKLDNRGMNAPAKSTVTARVKSATINQFDDNNLKRYVGKQAKIKLNNAKVRYGKIIAAENDQVTLQYTIGEKTIGAMSYELAYNQINSIEITD
jgi:hypothetical protein